MAPHLAFAGGRLAGLQAIAGQVSRYGIASIAALAADTGLYLALGMLGAMPALAAVAGYTLGLALHYMLSIHWVFSDQVGAKSRARLAAEFAASGMFGLLLTALTVALATSVLGLALLPAKVLAVGLSFLAVYALRRALVFAA